MRRGSDPKGLTLSMPATETMNNAISKIRNPWKRRPSVLPYLALFAICFLPAQLPAATASPLHARGYAVLPTPQRVTLSGKDFELTSAWRLEFGRAIEPNDAAIEILKDGLDERFHLTLGESKRQLSSGTIKLEIVPNAVPVGEATDRDKLALAEQAYKLDLSADRVSITANTPTGLFYGVATLLQLIKPQEGKLWLPEGGITDWPDLELRVIYWDDAHHLERLEVLKAALRQAAFYKINALAIKLEGHFQYKHAPAIVDPYALSPAELQDLTDYGRKYHVELIPYLDGPAHDAFILKHPEYSGLREYPQSNYEFCATNPETYKLFQGMFEDLVEATKGAKYFVLSTDEPYYIGLASNPQCNESERAKELGSVGKLLAEFLAKTAGYLHDHGRKVLFWGEFPLEPGDIDSLPSYLINGETYGPQFDPVFKARGIRQLLYTSTEGEEPLFPNYYLLPPERLLHPRPLAPGRVADMQDLISFASSTGQPPAQADSPLPRQADLMGTFVAGWADNGLHPETFWLGYATGPAVAWNRTPLDPAELMNSFYRLFYGPSAREIGRVYQAMSQQAEFWQDSWETIASSARTPIFGESYGVLDPPRPAHDQSLPHLPVPEPQLLRLNDDWGSENQRRLGLAGEYLAQNDSVLDLLRTNLDRVEFNRYNLEVFLSIAGLLRQNLEMILDLGRLSSNLKSAEAAAARADAVRALADVDRALDIAENIRQQRNRVLDDATMTWQKAWLPRVAEANGRRYLNQVDDVKDHLPMRTVDMTYLVYRELQYPLGEWARETLAARNEYARAHRLPTRLMRFDWKDTSTFATAPRAGDDGE